MHDLYTYIVHITYTYIHIYIIYIHTHTYHIYIRFSFVSKTRSQTKRKNVPINIMDQRGHLIWASLGTRDELFFFEVNDFSCVIKSFEIVQLYYGTVWSKKKKFTEKNVKETKLKFGLILNNS